MDLFQSISKARPVRVIRQHAVDCLLRRQCRRWTWAAHRCSAQWRIGIRHIHAEAGERVGLAIDRAVRKYLWDPVLPWWSECPVPPGERHARHAVTHGEFEIV